MDMKIVNRSLLVLFFLGVFVEAGLAQTSTADGYWIDDATWGGTSPGYTVGSNVTIDSYVISAATVTITGNNKTLNILDTLIIQEDLIFTATAGAGINVGPNNVLIILGNLDLGKNNAGVHVESGGVVVVKGDITASGTNGQFTGSGNIYTDGTVSGVANNGSGTVETIDDLSDDNLTDIEEYVNGGGDTPLPVDLLYFRAELTLNSVVLKWKTVTELNNDYFVIEKSVDGVYFEELSTISGSGTTNTPVVYEYVDYALDASVVYYRLKQVDFDGAFEYFDMTKVVIEGQAQTNGVYPSLIKGSELKLKGQNLSEIRIMNTRGDVLKREGVSGVQSIDVHSLTNGLYLVQLVSASGQITTQRIVVSR